MGADIITQTETTCPVIGSFGKAFETRLTDENDKATYISPEVSKVADSKSTPEVTQARAYRVIDWAVRTVLPMVLTSANMLDHAAKIAALPAVVDGKTAAQATELVLLAQEASVDAFSMSQSVKVVNVLANSTVWGPNPDKAAANILSNACLAVKDACANALYGLTKVADNPIDAAYVATAAAYAVSKAVTPDSVWSSASALITELSDIKAAAVDPGAVLDI